MVFRLSLLFLLFSLLVQSPLSAEGLFYQLPADGSWVEFAVEGLGMNPDDTEVTLKGTLRMSSVGTVTVDGKRCRWIEFKMDAKRNDDKVTTVDKLLFPEKHLGKGKSPLEHMLKGYQQHSQIKGGPRAVDAKKLKNHLVSELLHGPYKDLIATEKKRIKTKLGELDCEGVKALDPNGDIKCNREIRLHEKSPFGVVSLELQMEIPVKEETASMITSFKLLKTGKDAKSELPDSK